MLSMKDGDKKTPLDLAKKSVKPTNMFSYSPSLLPPSLPPSFRNCSQ